jgi:hypothetical protein
VREIVRLAFLAEKQYAPYGKWLGSSFARRKIAKKLTPILRQVLLAKTWKTREARLSRAYSVMAEQHNALKITRALSSKVSDYHGRPYSVIHADRFAAAIRKVIKDPQVKNITTEIGSIESVC